LYCQHGDGVLVEVNSYQFRILIFRSKYIPLTGMYHTYVTQYVLQHTAMGYLKEPQ